MSDWEMNGRMVESWLLFRDLIQIAVQSASLELSTIG